jgi:hypothetical protein
MRMSPDRVRALLKAELPVPEPLEPTPGHTPTRVFDPEEVSNAQKESVEPPVSHTQASPPARSTVQSSEPQPQSSPLSKSSPDRKQPFAVMGSTPARPPKLPSEFATLPAEALPKRRSERPRLAHRIKRGAGLLLLASCVFMTTFLVTKGLRDESARVRAWEFINGVGTRIGSWFSSQAEPPKPKTSSNVLSLRADSKSAAATAPAAATPPPAATADSQPPVVRLEDLEVLKDCAPNCAGTSAQSNSVPQRRPVRSRTR